MDSRIEKKVDKQAADIPGFLLEADTISITCICQREAGLNWIYKNLI